ncbi:uncharacterized protein LOC107861240 [Capsicum annuum]|uniref:uncharacterized protein LOC107861240 n=1 Tax=Capsicum annuum TaxID=4072 RepID=UPI0007BF9120|nr:uncharacterized protein LOC107861240 [Capsicum annuum]
MALIAHGPDMNLHYHPSKDNMIADAVTRLSMGSLSCVDKKKRGLVMDIFHFANLGVYILDLIDGVFYVSMLRKYVGDPSLIGPSEGVGILNSLSYEDVLVEILDQQVLWLQTKDVALVKILWRNQKADEASWEAGEDMKSKQVVYMQKVENKKKKQVQIGEKQKKKFRYSEKGVNQQNSGRGGRQ